MPKTTAIATRIYIVGKTIGSQAATAPLCRAAGADTFVAGTSFFRAADRTAFAAEFSRLT